MEEEYVEAQDSNMNDIVSRVGDMENQEPPKEFIEAMGYEEGYEEDDGSNNFRGGRGRGNFRGPPPGWMNGPPPMRFRGRGYGPGGPPMRGRGFYRGRGGPRYGPNGGPNFDNNWGPMGPPPPGMMGGPPPFGPPPGMMGPGGPMGPPPNMMGQPPPFGGPPGMPPPNMPQPELWVETKSEEGKSYYYHSRTRETTWTRPQESPTCKVITQSEIEAMAAVGQVPGMPTHTIPMNGPMGGPPMGGPMGMMPMMGGMVPPGVAPPSGPGGPPFMSQPPPWVKEGKDKPVTETASAMEGVSDEMPPGETAQSMQGANGGMGYGAPWGPWGWNQPPPAMAQQQQQPVQEPVQQDVVPVTPVPVKKEETVIPPELAVLAGEWSTHRAPDGRAYYYHAGRQESVWEKPKPLKQIEELRIKIALEKGEKPPKKIEKIAIDESKIEVIDVEAHAEAAAAAEAERRAAAERERERVEKERLEKERLEKEKVEKEKAEKEKAKQDKSRPISSTPISGTPWCVVWTGDGRVFFYNPTAHSSVWERPAQLLGRADVDKAVSQPPSALGDVPVARKEGVTPATTKPTNGELKRAADSDSDDSDAEPAKKSKPEEGKKAAVIDLGKEAAIEAEVRAARERALLPLEQRLAAFRGMLAERDVSAFSTWEKELHKIVFDTRYLLLTSKERKQVFDKYVRERAEEERKEKKNRLQLKKTAYRQLMEEVKLHSKSSFTDFSSKHGRDERFKGIDKPRDRETYFNEYIAEVRKKDKEEKEKKREQVKTEFIALLKEKSIDRHARWADAKKKVDSDPRYKAVESSTAREDYFREYCKIVKEERKKEKDGKEKERDRSSNKKEKKDKDRDKEKEKDKEGKEKKKKDKGEQEQPKEAVTEAAKSEADEEAVAREKEARAQASIKEREKEVQRALATSLRDRDKEREYHKRDEAVQHFNALLADLVRNPDLAWRDAKKQLKKDHRYSLAELLSKDDKERLFVQHTGNLSAKRREKLRGLLEELGTECTASWRTVKSQLKDDPRTPSYTSADKMEREFRDYLRDKQSAAKTSLRQLLLETRTITHKTQAAVKDNQQAMQQLHDSLKHDARYLALEHIAEERQQIITGYLEELEKKGPPPPPTATEPSRRAKQ